MNSQKSGATKYSNKHLIASISLSAALVLGRPFYAGKVFAVDNQLNWIKHEELDRLGGFYTSAATSADGNHLMLGVYEGGETDPQATSPLLISSNYGASWENVADNVDNEIRHYWTSVDLTDDGQTMVASSDKTREIGTSEDLDGKIVISEDGGDTWADITPAGTTEWSDVVVSGDGSTLAAVEEGWHDGEVFISTNGGDTWTPTAFAEDGFNAKTVSISDDGQKILVGGENGDPYTDLFITTNGGDTWSDVSPNPEDNVWEIYPTLSADGSKIAAATRGDANGVFISSNDGADWTDITVEDAASDYWADIAMSDDGSTLSVVDDDSGKMYITSDDGENWTEEDPGQDYEDSNTWRGIDMNEDGTKILVASYDNAYTSQAAEEPETESTVTLDNAEGGKTVTLTTPEGTTITCHSAVKESGLSGKDFAYSYPLGLVDFCFSGAETSNEVSIVFITDLKPSQVVARKYNPTSNIYTTITANITETTLEGQPALRVTYTLVDNGPLDTDPDVGEIADPVGLGVADVAVPNTGLRR